MVLNKNKNFKFFIKVIIMLVSALLQTFVVQAFITETNMISGGFTGLAILLNLVFSKIGINISLAFFIFFLNLPVALMCIKTISKKFVILSLIQIFSTSLFLKIFHFEPIFNNIMLNILIGAVIYGIQITMALKTGGSTGGTDFIALYVSNKINKTIWEYIFVFNMILLLTFGYLTSWDNAGYSIIFQFITTKTISTFYNRYHRITMQIYTEKPNEIIEKYVSTYNHGITKIVGEGGYSKSTRYILYAVVSVYEVNDIVRLILKIDKDAIINTFKTEDFYGKFYIPSL